MPRSQVRVLTKRLRAHVLDDGVGGGGVVPGVQRQQGEEAVTHSRMVLTAELVAVNAMTLLCQAASWAGWVRLLTSERLGEPGGVDSAFDCIGDVVAAQQAMSDVRRAGHMSETQGGSAFLVNVATEQVMVDSADHLVGGKSSIGSLGGSCMPDIDFRVFGGWYESGESELDSFVRARYRLGEINQACADLEAGRWADRQSWTSPWARSGEGFGSRAASPVRAREPHVP